jgi:hypothetical protein
MAQMPDPGLLEQIGVRIQPAFAGMMGGIVGAWADGKAGLAAWISYVGAGCLTANFLAEAASHIIGLNEGVSGFIVGLGALAIVRTIIGVIKKWHPQFGNGGNP